MDNQLKTEFEEKGYLILKGLYPAEEMAEWKARIRRKLEAKGWDHNPSGVSVWMLEDVDDFFLGKLTDRRLVKSLNAVIGPEIEFLSVKPVYKDRTTSFGSPWHQDWWYWRGSHKVSAWIALDRATQANGCLMIIPGSHGEILEASETKEEQGFDKRIDVSKVNLAASVSLEVEPGDAVIFHDLTLHASHPNTAGEDRWSFIATYRDAREPDASTVWKESLTLH